jgi:hypothetical protein
LSELQADIVGEPAAAQRPQFLEHEGRGDDGRSGIEGEAVLAELRRPSSRFIKLLDHSDAVAARAEPDGSGKAAEAGSDDDGVGPVSIVTLATGKRWIMDGHHGRRSRIIAIVCGAKRSII